MASERTRTPFSLRSSLPKTRVPFSRKAELPSLQDPNTQNVLHTIINGRKNWKTIRGGEIVWPPNLEAALIEGLERYEPDDSRETRILGRYPMRNKFISDYIFHKTGVRRTAKQVGSRLQQIRDRCTGKRVMKLLSPTRPSSRSHDSQSDTDESSSDTSSSPTTPVNAAFPKFSDTPKPSRTVVFIDILPEPTSSRRLFSHEQDTASDEVEPSSGDSDIFRASPYPRPFSSIDSTVTFVGPSNLSAHSSYVVRIRGVVVFKETTSLTSVGPAPGRTDGALLYSTKLVPGFWDRLSESSDPTQYTISQDVIENGPSPSTTFSALYKFKCPYPSTQQQPHHHHHQASPMVNFDDEMITPIFDIPSPASLDSFLSMDVSMDIPPFSLGAECVSSDPYYDFANIGQEVWGMSSPSQFSGDLATCYDQTFSDADLSPLTLSPAASATYSPGLSHYIGSPELSHYAL